MGDTIVTFEQVKQYENSDGALIIDVREPKEIAITGLIGGSINLPLAEVENCLKNMSNEEFKNKYGKSKPQKDSLIIFSCKLGGRAAKAMNLATNLGFKNAKCYKGSWNEWEQKSK